MTIAPLVLCLGWFGYRRFDRGSGPIYRSDAVDWFGSAGETHFDYLAVVEISTRHDSTITVRGARFEDLPRTAQPLQDGWIYASTIVFELWNRHETNPYPKDLGPGKATQVLYRFRVTCKPAEGTRLRLVVDYTINGREVTETIGRPVAMSVFSPKLSPC